MVDAPASEVIPGVEAVRVVIGDEPVGSSAQGRERLAVVLVRAVQVRRTGGRVP